jgi:WD repeat-containing protein 61
MKLAALKTVSNMHGESVWATWALATTSRPAKLLNESLDESVKIWRGNELDKEATNIGHSLGVVAVATHNCRFHLPLPPSECKA